jgi:hypothetical protein
MSCSGAGHAQSVWLSVRLPLALPCGRLILLSWEKFLTRDEVIAYLDTLHRSLMDLAMQVKELQVTVFKGVDSNADDVLD